MSITADYHPKTAVVQERTEWFMAETSHHTAKSEQSTLAGLISPEFAAMGKKRLEKLAEIQKQQLGIVQEINRHWIDRMQSEAKLASEFATKLTSARSMPEVATAYHEWTSRHLDMAAEDAKRIVADSQQLVETGARLLSNSWLTNGQGDGVK
jgi:anaerobic ribonucleoside-triphosphate reductase